MEKKSNMKQAMYEMFGVGSDQNDKDAPGEKTVTKTKSPVQPAKKEAVAMDKPMDKTTGKSPDTPVTNIPAKPKAEASYLAPGTVFEGNIRSVGDIEIAGEFKGNITTEGAVVLHSNIQGNVIASSLKLSGCSLTGDVSANDVVTVGAHSRVAGNVTARELVCAGQIIGDLIVSENVVLEKTAQINGNITTATIAVERGAVLKGGIEIKNA